MLKFKLFLSLAASLLLCSCQTPYKENGYMFGGYDDTRVDANTSIITFNGNYFTKQKTAETYVLYRAATVTIAAGYNFFIITSATSKPISLCTEGYCQLTSIARSTTHGSVAIIKMYRGIKPPGLPNSYDALEIIAFLGPSTFGSI
ncbi:MAG: hypothetical protein ABI597_07290 [Gammaproteobacteria bacterium]